MFGNAMQKNTTSTQSLVGDQEIKKMKHIVNVRLIFVIDRIKLLELMKTPIHPRIGADPEEVVADFIMDNEMKIQKEAEWEEAEWDWIPIAPSEKTKCSNCQRLKPQWVETSELHFCPNCGCKMKEV